MKKLGFLLKLSFISVASTMLVSNDYIQTIIGIGRANAGELFDANKYGNYGDVVSHFTHASIMNSNCKWAKEALSGKTEYTSSIEALNNIVSVYEDNDKYGTKSAARTQRLRSAIETIVRKYSTPDNKHTSIDEWHETPYAKSVMSLINGLMACHTLENYLNQSYAGRTVFYRTIEELYASVFSDVINSLNDAVVVSAYDCKHNDYRLSDTIDPLLISILNHFGYNDTRNNLGKALNAFNQYLYHDFYCYFVQTGLISVGEKHKFISEESVLEKINLTHYKVDSIRRDIDEHENVRKHDVVEKSEKMCITDIDKTLNKNNEVSNFMKELNKTLKYYNCETLSENIFDENYLTALHSFYRLSLTRSQLDVLQFHKKLVTDLLNKKIIKKSELTRELILFILDDFTYKNYNSLFEKSYKPASNVSVDPATYESKSELLNMIEPMIIDEAETIKDTADKLKLTNFNIRVLLKAAFVLTRNYHDRDRNHGYDGGSPISLSMNKIFQDTGPYRKPWAYDFEYVVKNALHRKDLVFM